MSRKSGSSAALCAGVVYYLNADAGLAAELPEESAGAERTLSEVLVLGNRPTSLPTEIPTTIEGITAEDIEATINATDAEDALKYFPSLLVRKRYIGDYDHAVLATRASGTGNSARSLVYADGILLSNLLGNGANFTPRWGLVTPEEIERVDVLYGPFSAAYPGNSVGAVVDYVTRMPDQLEAHVRIGGFTQNYEDPDYGVDDRYSGYQGSASIGSRVDKFSWWVNFNHLDSDSQPITFANKLVSTTPSAAGTPVTGALPGRNPRNQPWLILGPTNQTHTVQDHAKLKVAFDFTASLRASYTLGLWLNDVDRDHQTLLRDANGTPVDFGTVNIDGSSYAVTGTDFSNSHADLRHVIHGVSVKTDGSDAWNWEVAGSFYDYSKDEIRSSLRTVANAVAGRLADMDGTQWSTLAAKGVWRATGGGTHVVDFGLQRDAQQLRTKVFNTDEWRAGAPLLEASGLPFSSFQGNTSLSSIYAQDTWRFAERWRTTLGVRVERWRASNGAINSSVVEGGERSDTYVSPKAALALQVGDEWILKTSVGRAVRNPTVSELYQGSTVSGVVVNNDPFLQPERLYTAELTAEREVASMKMRSTVFHEDTRDALYSQQTIGFGGTQVNTVQNVEHIRTTGVELVYQATGLGLTGLDLTSSVTYARSRIVENSKFLASEGKWQPRVPDWRANLLATYRWGDDWVFSFGTRYSGRQYNTLDNSDPNGKSFTGVSKFLVMDLRVRYRFAEQWHASFGIDNANNDDYWNFHPYPQRTYVGELSWDL